MGTDAPFFSGTQPVAVEFTSRVRTARRRLLADSVLVLGFTFALGFNAGLIFGATRG